VFFFVGDFTFFFSPHTFFFFIKRNFH
jgi:hypothetical protein